MKEKIKLHRKLKIEEYQIEELVRENLSFFGLDIENSDFIGFYIDQVDYYSRGEIECWINYKTLETNEEFEERLKKEKINEDRKIKNKEIAKKRIQTKEENIRKKELAELDRLTKKYKK